MFVDYRGSLSGVLQWQWRPILLSVVVSTAVVVLDWFELVQRIRISALPLAIVGGAIGIFVSFRTNSAYDRWWEGRRLWGTLINASRHLATQALSYVAPRGEDGKELAHRVIRRHIAYVHVLRCLLRSQDPLKDEEAIAFLSEDEQRALVGDSNMTHALLHAQAIELVAFADAGKLEERRLQSMDETLRVILDVQGGCERIKKTPMPRGYGYFAELLIRTFGFLLPLGLVADHHVLTIPITVLVCLAFTLISEVGRVLEDPFTMFWPALPLSALAKTIEINLRERLGERGLPPLPKPVDGILM
jgi:putative membrane protein